jgi:3-isopropylmalate/(R)-2-methylmalate dehydratase small subunit
MELIRSLVIPLPLKDVDTDMIIPAEYLRRTNREGLGQHLFARLRAADKHFPFNLEKYRYARILLARSNFGCGSSREHAAWALADWGIQAVIAPSFADIFYKNALNNGILPVRADDGTVESIFDAVDSTDDLTAEIDVKAQTVSLTGGIRFTFDIEPFPKELLLSGGDALDYLLARREMIERFLEAQEKHLYMELGNI